MGCGKIPAFDAMRDFETKRGEGWPVEACADDLQVGDVISAVNGISISGADSLRVELDKVKAGSPVVLEIEREGIYRFVSFEME
jgi:C-terminal processing protease CtpA/Prc